MMTNRARRRLAAAALLAAIISAPASGQDGGEASAPAPADPLPRRDDAPLEQIDGVETRYGSVMTSDGVRLRTLVSRPENAAGPLHPVLFTQWVSCGSIEYREGSGAREILAAIARESGLALLRVERAGDGDSEGSACAELDYDTELAHYIDAYRQLLQSDGLDTSEVYVYGSSLGSTTAALLAQTLQEDGYDIAGVAVKGGGAQTYFERMMTFDRFYLERRPDDVPAAAITEEMAARAIFHAEYLLKGRAPDDIATDGDMMAAVRADVRGLDADGHYGRPFAWHQQIAQHDVLEAWSVIDAPVLVIFNSYDQFEGRAGHALIVDIVNRERPGTARLTEQDGLGHSDYRYASIQDAYANEGGEPAWRRSADALVSWLQETAHD